jgi:hypothetical protein
MGIKRITPKTRKKDIVDSEDPPVKKKTIQKPKVV